MQTNYECQIRCNGYLSCEKKEREKRIRRISSQSLWKKRRRNRQRKPESIAAAVHAVTAVVAGLVVGAGGEVGVVVEGVSAHVDVRVVAVGKEFLHFPVVGALADGEFEIFLGNGIPELYTS